MSIACYRLSAALPVFALLASGALAAAQTPQPAVPAPSPVPPGVSTAPAIAGLRPALDQVGAAVANLRIAHWKAPEDVRNSSQEDVGSIQRDLSATLPPLLAQAQAAGSPSSPLAPSFAVFRNIDALYDVLLRITEMANIAGSEAEAAHLEDARASLEAARAQLANSLLAGVSSQDDQLARFRAQRAAAAKPAAPPPAKIVVDDGPEAAKPKHHKKKPAPTPPPQQ